jgi:hypothetical protein
MAVVALKAANVTKVNAGGSGDNYVADGLIKTVEKVWTDTYVLAAVTTTHSAITIAKVPKGKKITDIIVHLPAVGTVTNGTISLTTTLPTNTSTAGTLGLVHGTPGNPDAAIDATLLDLTKAQTVRLNPANALTQMTEDSDISLMFTIPTTLTGGTIRSIVKYT